MKQWIFHVRLRDDECNQSGRLALGANPTVSTLHLPNILAQYHQAIPKVELSLTTHSSEELVQKIRQFQLDGAFVKTPVHDDNLVEELIYEEELVLITQPWNDNLQAICQQPFLMNTAGCPHREQLENWLKSIGLGPVRYLEFNHLDVIIQGVVSGLGASLVPRSAIQTLEEKEALRSFSLPSKYALTKVNFIRHKESFVTNALDQFMKLLRQSPLYHQNIAGVQEL